MQKILALLAIVFVSFACSNTKKDEPVSEQSSKVEYKVEYAKQFRFSTKGNVQILEILHPDTKKVIASMLPLGANKKTIALSGTFIGMIAKLGLEEEIVGVSEMKYVHNNTLKQKFRDGKVFEAGYDTQMNVERMVAGKPAIIFHSGYNAEFAHQKQFEAVGIICMPVYDWREDDPLGKAEWIKVYGFLFGEMEKANAIFEELKNEYNALKDEVSQLPPSEKIISGNMIGAEWCSPAGGSFFAQLMKDANINYGYADSKGTGSVMHTQEQILMENRHAKYWINPGAKSLKDLLNHNPKAELFDAFQNKEVYCYLNDDNLYWEVSSIEPAKLLADLVHIAHPNYFDDNFKFTFYSKLQ